MKPWPRLCLLAALGLFPSGAVARAGTPEPEATPDSAATSAPENEKSCFSGPELELLSQLVERQSELDQREADLKTREQAIAELEARLKEELQTYTAIQEELGKAAETRVAEADKHTKELASAYEAMSPAEAAARLAGMDKGVAIAILRGMKGRAAGKVLESLGKEKAVELSQMYAKPNPLSGKTP